MTTSTENASTENASTSRRSARRRVRRVLGLALTGAALTTVVGAGQASASTSLYGGVGSDSISCGSTGLYQNIRITPQTGYGYGQAVGYRLYVHDLTAGTAGWTSWYTFSASQQIMGWSYPTTGHAYEIYVNYAWYRSTGWVTAGEWITAYTHRTGGTPQTTRYCLEY